MVSKHWTGRIDPDQYKGERYGDLAPGVHSCRSHIFISMRQTRPFSMGQDYLADLEKMDVRILDDLLINS